jgi:hypothetical protein
MEQLRNINHGFDIEKGDVGVTVRKGSKWYDFSTGKEFELRVCPAGHDGECNSLCEKVGHGKKIGGWRGALAQLPKNLLSIEHNIEARDYEKLVLMLEKGYGSISPSDTVTAMIYVRVE